MATRAKFASWFSSWLSHGTNRTIAEDPTFYASLHAPIVSGFGYNNEINHQNKNPLNVDEQNTEFNEGSLVQQRKSCTTKEVSYNKESLVQQRKTPIHIQLECARKERRQKRHINYQRTS
ncbi:16759_t:CDS:2 [Cetraspora pellucida]|uniref:16759_t:CDS:1 n=1 Tax=Cetraspora pellucida TaxID=1433469 RepID=A0A9N9ETG6_9GLOM|nr:16759_t:CDS:2 [Cetraspora pellucida]